MIENKIWLEGDTATYPQDWGYTHILELSEKIAKMWVKDKFPDNPLDDWLNKKFIIIDITLTGTFALYNHDDKYSLIKMRDNMNKVYYANTCPETEQVFIYQEGVDNNIAEVFSRGENETVGDNAEFICEALNKN